MLTSWRCKSVRVTRSTAPASSARRCVATSSAPVRSLGQDEAGRVVHLEQEPGRHVGGGVRLLDDRRSGERGARPEPGAAHHRGLRPLAATAQHPALRRRLAGAALVGPEGDRGSRDEGRRAEVDGLDRLVLEVVPVGALVLLVEARRELLDEGRGAWPDRDRELERLVHVTVVHPDLLLVVLTEVAAGDVGAEDR